MKYLFERGGKVVEREYPMGEAPLIGTVDADGWKRIVALPRIASLGSKRHVRQKIVAYGIHKRGVDPENPAPHYNEKGYACFDSDAEIREFCARSQDTKTKWVYDAQSDFSDTVGEN